MDNFKTLIAFFIIIMLCGCTPTRYVPVETVRTETRDVVHELAVLDTLRLETVIYDRGDTVIVPATAGAHAMPLTAIQ